MRYWLFSFSVCSLHFLKFIFLSKNFILNILSYFNISSIYRQPIDSWSINQSIDRSMIWLMILWWRSLHEIVPNPFTVDVSSSRLVSNCSPSVPSSSLSSSSGQSNVCSRIHAVPLTSYRVRTNVNGSFAFLHSLATSAFISWNIYDLTFQGSGLFSANTKWNVSL